MNYCHDSRQRYLYVDDPSSLVAEEQDKIQVQQVQKRMEFLSGTPGIPRKRLSRCATHHVFGTMQRCVPELELAMAHQMAGEVVVVEWSWPSIHNSTISHSL